ncbi:uncharacterized protein [Miscanthus floridulus]|uniref:uncharacterized protein n=1 Tax=Miscanthus floridulus TaxID=154761 RepID=UPI00345778BD
MDFSAPSFSLGFDWDDDDDPPSGRDRSEQPRGYEAPDPPSFSLGIDDVVVEEPRIRAGDRQKGHARGSTAPDPPSFSLGFDDDVVDEPRIRAGGRRKEHARGYTAPDPPSFSLGFDDDVVEEPRIRAGGRRKEHARGYTAPDPPSFSLGFDDEDGDGDILAADQSRERARPPVAPGAPSSTGAADDDDKEDGFVLAGGRRPVRVERHRLDPDPLPPPRLETNRFAAPDPPSFSLGFDDEDSYGDILAADQRREQARPQAALVAPSSTGTEDDDDKEDDFVLAGGKRPVRVGHDTIDTDPLPPPAETNRFKRLRRGPAPAHPAPTPQVLHCEVPSSSLIISDDDDNSLAGGQHHEQPKTQAAPQVPSSLSIEDEDGDFFLAGDRQPEPTLPEVTQLKRLRKGPAPPHLAPSPPPLKVPGQPTVEASPVMSENGARTAVGSWEDEIEDWTTDEDRPVRDVPPSVGSCSTSSNSKFSLLNHGVLMTQSATKANRSKFTQTPNTSASISLEESCTKKLLPKITVSPMRKIYLLDSDTDADDDHNQNKAKTLQQNTKPQGRSTVLKSAATMNDNWATPALDEFCNEYFKSPKDAEFSQQKEGNTSQPKNSGHFQQQMSSSGAELDDGPPAMHYLFHPDPRVGNLFRNRLQHFVPIGAGSTRGNEQNRAESLRRRFSSSAAANDDWVTPGRISVPTDASKRRVHASGSHLGSGHWFTDDSGRKVYVSKNGQELTGRNAYRQYRKESGRGFGRKKGSSGTKRGAAKVKTETVAKRGTSRAKRKR